MKKTCLNILVGLLSLYTSYASDFTNSTSLDDTLNYAVNISRTASQYYKLKKSGVSGEEYKKFTDAYMNEWNRLDTKEKNEQSLKIFNENFANEWFEKNSGKK